MKVIFKHSYKCPVSRRAKQHMDALVEDNPNAFEYEFVDVFENRKRSDEIAANYDITHESPQVIILDDDDKVTWHAAHREISEENLRDEIFTS